MTQSATLLLTLAASLALATATACQPLELPPERTSGPDRDRSGASEISIGATIIDDLDPLGGDSTDWKYVTIPGPGILTIKISFDNPKALGELTVTDERGVLMSNYKDVTRGILDNITFKGQGGQYFLMVNAREGNTTYTLEVRYDAL